MANINAMFASHLKKKIAVAQAEVDRLTSMLQTVEGDKPAAKPKQTRKRRGNRNPQAAIDAIAVKRNTATPVQLERHNARLAAKAKPNGSSQASLV